MTECKDCPKVKRCREHKQGCEGCYEPSPELKAAFEVALRSLF